MFRYLRHCGELVGKPWGENGRGKSNSTTTCHHPAGLCRPGTSTFNKVLGGLGTRQDMFKCYSQVEMIETEILVGCNVCMHW